MVIIAGNAVGVIGIDVAGITAVIGCRDDRTLVILVQELPVRSADSTACIAHCRCAHIARVDVAVGDAAVFYFKNQIVAVVNQVGRYALHCVFRQPTFGIIFKIGGMAGRHDFG